MKNTVSFVLMLFFVSSVQAAVTFSDMNGSNGDVDKLLADEMGLSIVRIDLSWNKVESTKGVYGWDAYDKKILSIKNKGIQVLPVLAYTPEWNKVYPNKVGSPPHDYSSWIKFVKAAVARYSSEPYNIKYFQVWNEPTKKANYWLGTNDDFVNKIYIPAAKEIRSKGGMVVFGGWPASNSINELDRIMFKLNAIKYTDIIDFHYGNEGPYNHLYENYLKPGYVKGIWQTELGFRTEQDGLLRIYLTIFHWMLSHNWSSEDQYKLFWYPGWGSREKELRGLTTTLAAKNTVPTKNGNQLSLLNSLYGGGNLKLADLSVLNCGGCTPGNAFAVSIADKKIVIANLSKVVAKFNDSMQYTVNANFHPNRAFIISSGGEKKAIEFTYDSNKVIVRPFANGLHKKQNKIFFIQIE
ncbi:TPA: hypothetical protein MB325_001019 [Klebsiella quasipneumoniae subsp. quasipneumoniae]|nr:hypothetical protein [Klebsiella quasipneumoniae subsp. quasipneumoniae]